MFEILGHPIGFEEKETVADLKSKLNLQKQQREIYEKQHNEIMEILDLPKENLCFKAGDCRVLCIYPVYQKFVLIF